MDATPIIIKKKKSHGGGHHGGSWKVAYADFVTAMMAFFMVMWIMGLSDETRAQIQGYFSDPIGFAKNMPHNRAVISPKTVPLSKSGTGVSGANTPYQNEQKAMQELKKEIEKALKSAAGLDKLLKKIHIEITPEGLRLEFIEDRSDFFESGSAVLKPGAIVVIKVIAPKLVAAERRMIVEGHTDSVPFGSDPMGNFKLSGDRAEALADQLCLDGVPRNRFKSITGLADTDLRDPAHPTSAVNRRVTVLLPFDEPVSATVPKPKDEVRHLLRDSVIPDDLKAPPSVKPIGPPAPDITH